MNILMVLENDFPPDIRVENEILALIKAGHSVSLACSTRRNKPLSDMWNGAHIYRKHISNLIYKSSVGALKVPLYFTFWRRFVTELTTRNKFDVIHIHDLPLAKIGAEMKRRKHLKFVLDLHENWPALLVNATHTKTIPGRILSSNRQWVKYEKMMISQADLVITIIEESKDRLKGIIDEPSKIVVVSNTINLDNLNIKVSEKTGDDLVLFYGGGINRHRGIQIVIQAIKKAGDKRIKFVVVGTGSYRQDLEKLAADLQLEDQIFFAGYKPYNEMMNILAGSDIAIIPHLRSDNNDASSPNKIYQYMYLEKAVISSNCVSLERLIRETDSGFVYEHDSSEDLAKLLLQLISNRYVLKKKGENGKKAVLEKYNWNQDSKKLITGYQLLS